MPKSKAIEASVDEQIMAVIDDPSHVRISEQEKREIYHVIHVGQAYGYGNMISWLATAWAIHLRAGGLPETTAIEAVSNMGPHPLPKIEPAKKGKRK